MILLQLGIIFSILVLFQTFNLDLTLSRPQDRLAWQTILRSQNVRSPGQLLASIDEQQFIVSHKLRTYMRSSNCKYFFASLYYLRKEKVIVRHVPFCMLSLISTQFYPGIFFSFSLSKEANKAIVRVRLRITYLIENKFFLLRV